MSDHMKIEWSKTDMRARIAKLEAENERLRSALAGYGRCDAELAIAERALAERAGGVKVSRQSILDAVRSFDLEGGNIPERFADHLASALEPAAPEPKTLVHEPMVWTGEGPYGFSPAAPEERQEAVAEAALAQEKGR